MKILKNAFLLGLVAYAQVSSAETVTIDMANDQGAPTYRASGFLHGMTSSTPNAYIVDSIKPKMFRCAEWTCFDIYSRATNLGAQIQFNLSDSIGYHSPWPTDSGSAMQNWLNMVTRIVNQAKANGQTYQWDIWNEPDQNFFWGPSYNQYYEMWRQTYIKIRQLDPNAVIVGPSTSWYGGVKGFLAYAKANNVLPDVLAWHEMESPIIMADNIADVRQYMSANGINISRISLNEYIGANDVFSTGATVHYFGKVERAKIESSAHACWSDGTGADACGNNTLDGIVTPGDKSPRSAWWAYKGYADITGKLVGLTPGSTTDGVAGTDSGQKTARVILGRNDYSASAATMTVEALIKNINSASYLIGGGKVHVVASMIRNYIYEPMGSTEVVINADYTVSNNQVSIMLPNFNPREAYTIVITNPGGAPAPAPNPAPSAPKNLKVL